MFREHLSGIYTALNEPIPVNVRQAVEAHEAKTDDHRPQGFIHPLINGKGDQQDWDKAGRLEVGGARGTMHQSSAIQRLWYGVDHLNFYLRLDFKSGIQQGRDLPVHLNLFWFYPGQTMHNSPIPLQDLPDQSPMNYQMHHHLEINLLNLSLQFREAADNLQWQPRFTRAQVALDNCLEVAVPWADLQVPPDYPLRLVLVLSDQGRFSSYLPENTLIPIEVP